MLSSEIPRLLQANDAIDIRCGARENGEQRLIWMHHNRDYVKK
jgi:hypothetical protein